jgi:hypothetical protein
MRRELREMHNIKWTWRPNEPSEPAEPVPNDLADNRDRAGVDRISAGGDHGAADWAPCRRFGTINGME